VSALLIILDATAQNLVARDMCTPWCLDVIVLTLFGSTMSTAWTVKQAHNVIRLYLLNGLPYCYNFRTVIILIHYHFMFNKICYVFTFKSPCSLKQVLNP